MTQKYKKVTVLGKNYLPTNTPSRPPPNGGGVHRLQCEGVLAEVGATPRHLERGQGERFYSQ